MPEERRPARHKMIIEQRENVSISGVTDVISFDEEQVICDTDLGVLILRGENLHVNNLNLDSGSLEIFGQIVGISYEDQGQGQIKGKQSFFGKIFK